MKNSLIAALLILGCQPTTTTPEPTPPAAGGSSTLAVHNETKEATTLFVAFGSDSEIKPSGWKGCEATGPLTCTMPLKSGEKHPVALAGKYLNATLSFGAAVACGITKAELNLNNPEWYDTTDISLVDGFSNQMMIKATDASGEKTLGPVISDKGNEKNFGVFPLGCDGCALRIAPPCGQSPGGTGCHGGSQYNPDPVCQYQSGDKGGSTAVVVSLIDAVPAEK